MRGVERRLAVANEEASRLLRIALGEPGATPEQRELELRELWEGAGALLALVRELRGELTWLHSEAVAARERREDNSRALAEHWQRRHDERKRELAQDVAAAEADAGRG